MAVYFEAAAAIVTLVLLGQVLELRARQRTGAAIKALLGLAPKSARRISADGDEEDVPLDRIQPGDRLRVRPGEKRSVDGIVREGHGGVDESMVTGEPIGGEKSRRPGHRRHGQQHRRLIMEAQRVGADTLLSQIVHGGANGAVARPSKAGRPGRRLLRARRGGGRPDHLCRLGDLWAASGPGPCPHQRRGRAHHRLSLRAGPRHPMSIMTATGKGATVGVLFKNAEAIEMMRQIDTLVVDKTGTLTEGKPKLVTVAPGPESRRGDPARLAAAVGAGQRTSAGRRHRQQGLKSTASPSVMPNILNR